MINVVIQSQVWTLQFQQITERISTHVFWRSFQLFVVKGGKLLSSLKSHFTSISPSHIFTNSK